MKRGEAFVVFVSLGLAIMLATSGLVLAAAKVRNGPGEPAVRVNIQVVGEISPGTLRELSRYARSVNYVFQEVGWVTATVPKSKLDDLAADPLVQYIELAVGRRALSDQMSLPTLMAWDQDMIQVEHVHQAGYTGEGATVAVLDTGLLHNWRDYLSESHILAEHGMRFDANDGFGASNPPLNITEYGTSDEWDKDTHGHGTHVTSTILGYRFDDDITLTGAGGPEHYVLGAAPDATVLPVKVLGDGGFGWDSMVAAGIYYTTELRRQGTLGPTVISMSLGGSVPSLMEQQVLGYAISNGVLVVAAAGNEGTAGMSWPGAYPEVISAAAAGWTMQWTLVGDDGSLETGTVASRAWWLEDVPEDITVMDARGNTPQTFIADFSSRENQTLVEELRETLGDWVPRQELDLAAPGEWVVGPFPFSGAATQPETTDSSGIREYFFVSGTSMATPHISGVLALLLQRDPTLTQARAEALLKGTAHSLGDGITPGSVQIYDIITGAVVTLTWEADGMEATGAGLLMADSALMALG
jgi:subtilisin family serine protease